MPYLVSFAISRSRNDYKETISGRLHQSSCARQCVYRLYVYVRSYSNLHPAGWYGSTPVVYASYGVCRSAVRQKASNGGRSGEEPGRQRRVGCHGLYCRGRCQIVSVATVNRVVRAAELPCTDVALGGVYR